MGWDLQLFMCIHLQYWLRLSWMFKILTRSWRGVLDTTLCDKVCQWLATGRWFSPRPPVSTTNNIDHHDITETLLKVVLNTINQPLNQIKILRTVFSYHDIIVIEKFDKSSIRLKSDRAFIGLQDYDNDISSYLSVNTWHVRVRTTTDRLGIKWACASITKCLHSGCCFIELIPKKNQVQHFWLCTKQA